MKELLLIVWLMLTIAFNGAVVAVTGWLVFWHGHSKWWFLLAAILCDDWTLGKTLRHHFGVRE